MKQPAPPPPIFVKVVEIKQKNHIFQCFARWLGLLIFQPCWFKRNITCKLKVSIRRGFWKIVDFWFSENSQEIVYSRVWKGAELCFESWHQCTLHHFSYGINSKRTQMNVISCWKMITATLKQYVYYYCSIFINKFEQIEYPLLMFISWSLNR